MSYDPWLYDRSFPADRLDQEAAQRAREAAGTLGADFVTGQLADARRIGERQARERAEQLAAEAHAHRDMQQRIASGQLGASYIPPPQLTEAEQAEANRQQAIRAEQRQQAVVEAERQRVIKAEQQRLAAAEAARKQELRDQNTRRVATLNRRRSTDLQIAPLLFGHAWLYIACSVIFGMSMLFGMLAV